MRDRATLQILLEELMESKNVYFDPPPSLSIKYPAIVYTRDTVLNRHADNKLYSSYIQYNITLIDKKSDSLFFTKLLNLPFCKHDRHFKTDNLNHDVFTLYY